MFSWNSVLAGDKGDIWHVLVEFRWPYLFHHEIGHSGSNRRNIENIQLSV